MLLSSGLAVGGLGLGWLVYGRKPLVAGQMDPLQKGMEKIRLGWLYKAMQKRFYFDEIYAGHIYQRLHQVGRYFL